MSNASKDWIEKEHLLHLRKYARNFSKAELARQQDTFVYS